MNASGRPFQVFTPFWKACLERGLPAPAPDAHPSWAAAAELPRSEAIDSLGLLPRVDWAGGLRAAWTPGERGALDALARFTKGPVGRYAGDRDRPDLDGVSRLSPHLHFGEVSPARIAAEVASAYGAAADPFVRQLGWRESAHHLLHHFPHTADRPLRPEFEAFPWSDDPDAEAAWRQGRTGYPIVDAGMRELWTTGWMHNRVRMIAASFLTKDLLIPWQSGARWFWDTLVDADLANNTLGWQWTAGCGADAAPYFRVFNPCLQAAKFDPKGEYVRRWAPDPCEPIVDHSEARHRALGAYAAIRGDS